MRYEDSIIIPLIIGLNEILKMLGVDSKYIPVFSVLMGLAFGIFLLFPGELGDGIVNGLYLGLSSVGLYSGAKNISEAVKKE